MVESRNEFNRRLDGLSRDKRPVTHGYITRIDQNGLLIVEKRPQRRKGEFRLLKFLLLTVIGFMCFKVFTLSAIGEISYTARLALLQEGTVIEQAGAAAMAIDPVTAALSEIVGPILR